MPKVRDFPEIIAQSDRILAMNKSNLSIGIGKLNKNSLKLPPCDYIEKVAFEAFPSWKSNWPRTNFAPSLDHWADRKPSVGVSNILTTFFRHT